MGKVAAALAAKIDAGVARIVIVRVVGRHLSGRFSERSLSSS
jgi:hypothetical protein